MQDAPFLEVGVDYGDDYAWLWRRRFLPPKDPLAELQGEMYSLASMLRIVRRVAGSSWNPPDIRIESPASDWVTSIEGLGGSRVSFGGRVMAIAIPYDLLDLHPPEAAMSDSIPTRDDLPAAATDLAGSLQQALTPLMGVVPLTVEIGAEIAETTPRTLRRRLEKEGTSWRQILNRARFELAQSLLLEPALTIAEIAYELGYSDPAHFTRAFHSWTGEGPRDFRSRRLIH